MFSHQTLDRVADAHNPMLGCLWFALVGAALLRRQGREAARRAAVGLACLVVAYGLEYVDIATGLWPRLGLDYSTHTAVAVAMVATLRAGARGAGLFAACTTALYVPLMIHQGYHGVGDILSTAAAVALIVALPARWTAAPLRIGEDVAPRPAHDRARGPGRGGGFAAASHRHAPATHSASAASAPEGAWPVTASGSTQR
jgi:hypothetical protein